MNSLANAVFFLLGINQRFGAFIKYLPDISNVLFLGILECI